MVRFPLVGLEGVGAFACSEVAAIVAACRLATAAIPALPIRNRRRQGEGGADSFIATASVRTLLCECPSGSFRSPHWLRIDLYGGGQSGREDDALRHLIDMDAHRNALCQAHPGEDRVDRGE